MNKAKMALLAIKLIKPYLKNVKPRQLITSNFNSILYYSSEIWHIPTLTVYSKRQLLSASSLALKLYTHGDTSTISFSQLYIINQRATPAQYMIYNHALQLYRVLNNKEPVYDWVVLNFT